MNEKVVKALNDQLNFELYSSYLYMGMSAYLKSTNLQGFAHWMEIQTKEELAHALKLYSYLSDRGVLPVFETVEKPHQGWKSVIEIFKSAYEHEKIVTSRFNDIVDLAIREKDHTTNMHVQWYLNEQIEEESNILGVYQKLDLIKNDAHALLMLDKDLSSRVFVDPNAPASNAGTVN